VVPVPVLAVSSMQSMCTGLDECSFAAPVLLSASLPAFLFLKLLQRGLLACDDALASFARLVVPVAADDCLSVVLLLVAEGDVAPLVEDDVWASAGAETPRMAAVAILLMKWLRIMVLSSCKKRWSAVVPRGTARSLRHL
jgi:hypothetical protein